MFDYIAIIVDMEYLNLEFMLLSLNAITLLVKS